MSIDGCNSLANSVNFLHRDPTLQLILQMALDGAIIMRSDGIIVDWNAQAEQIFGWTRDEIIGVELGEALVPPLYREQHRRGLQHYLETGEGPVLGKRIEITALRKSGEEFPIELSITPIERDGEKIFVGFTRDITDRRATERVLAFQAKEAALLYRVTSLAAETSSRDDILKVCLESVCDLTGWPVGRAHLVTTEGALVAVASVGPVDTTLGETTDADSPEGISGLPGSVLASKKPQWFSVLSDGELHVAGGFRVRSAFGFPIIIAGGVAAVLEFFSPVGSEPDANLLLTVQTMGDQVGRVLERRAVEQHQALLLAELNHRAKNMLSVVMGMATQTARHTGSFEAFKSDFFERLTSLARAYALLTDKNWQPSTLESIVSTVVEPHAGGQLEISGTAVMLEPKRALAMSMVLHELTTNATKYGALSTPDGTISISAWVDERAEGPVVSVRWRETGLAGLVAPTRTGFGSELIDINVRHTLRGNVTTTYQPTGVLYDLEFPALLATSSPELAATLWVD